MLRESVHAPLAPSPYPLGGEVASAVTELGKAQPWENPDVASAVAIMDFPTRCSGKTQPWAWPMGEIESDDAGENPDVGNTCVSTVHYILLMAPRLNNPSAAAMWVVGHCH